MFVGEMWGVCEDKRKNDTSNMEGKLLHFLKYKVY